VNRKKFGVALVPLDGITPPLTLPFKVGTVRVDLYEIPLPFPPARLPSFMQGLFHWTHSLRYGAGPRSFVLGEGLPLQGWAVRHFFVAGFLQVIALPYCSITSSPPIGPERNLRCLLFGKRTGLAVTAASLFPLTRRCRLCVTSSHVRPGPPDFPCPGSHPGFLFMFIPASPWIVGPCALNLSGLLLSLSEHRGGGGGPYL